MPDLGRTLPRSLSWPFASELVSALVGFGVMITLARRLGPSRFADLEYAAAVAGWWLVVVRGGFDVIVTREAARRPALVRPLTDALVGLRCVSAIVGLSAVLGLAWFAGSGRGEVVAIAGLVLIPSALATDVGLRASDRFPGLALAQLARVATLATGVGVMALTRFEVRVAALFVVAAEFASTIVLWAIHGLEHGGLRPRFRGRAWWVLATRGGVAGLTRFARVTLYSVDLLILGMLASGRLGSYAAARRVAFAVLAIGLVVPASVGPRIARAWAAGSSEAREVIARTLEGLFLVALPASSSLMATADRWMPWLFGDLYDDGGVWLALIAARLPFVLASNVQQTALTACRLEGISFRLALGMVGLALVALPLLAFLAGPWGLGLGLLGIEILGAVGGWLALRSRDLAPSWDHASLPALASCLGLAAVCRVGHAWPLGWVVVAAAVVYASLLVLIRGLSHDRGSRARGALVVPGGLQP